MIHNLFSLLLSLIVIAGITLDFPNENRIFLYARSFLIFPLFLIVLYAIRQIGKDRDKRLKMILAILTGVLSSFHVCGELLVNKGTVLWLFRDFGTLFRGFLHWAAYGILLFILFFILFHAISKATPKTSAFLSRIPFPILWLMLIAAWLPWYLNQFPAIMTADTTDQIEMALGVEELTDHHPVFYTFLIKTALQIGGILNPEEPNQAGIIFFICLQFILMTAVCAAVLHSILEISQYRSLSVCVLLFFLFYPVNPLYSATMWKDVPFSLCLFAFTALLFCEMREHKKGYCLGMAISGILLTLFRHNGIYIILLSLPFIYTGFKYRWKPVFFSFLAIILVFFAWDKILLPSLKIPAGSPAESLSIPLQQIALTAKRQHEHMDEDLLDELNQWFDEPEIWTQYTFRISDPVKNHFDDERYQNNPKDFWNFYFSLGKAYPQDFLDGFLLHTYGYWYPETPHWVFVTGIDDDGIFGIHSDPKFTASFMNSTITWLTEAKYDEIPLLSLLFSPGACFWLFLAGFCFCLYQKSSTGFLFIPVFILWLTAVASPVNCEFRYVYGMFLCMPILLTAASTKN